MKKAITYDFILVGVGGTDDVDKYDSLDAAKRGAEETEKNDGNNCYYVIYEPDHEIVAVGKPRQQVSRVDWS